MNKVPYAFICFLVILFLYSDSFACSCVGPGSPKEALKNWSDAVFTGEIIAVDEYHFTFKVERVWKGVNEKEVVIIDSLKNTSCGSGLMKGKRYIIFASSPKDKTTSINSQGKPIFHINTCSWSASLENSIVTKKIFKRIGKGKPIKQSVS